MTGAGSMEMIGHRIQEKHPGTVVYNVNRFEGWSSLETMWHQVLEIGKDVANISSQHPEGINIIGYSQGGLVARGIIQTFSNITVDTFISLSSPQAGQYGAGFLHLVFPGLVKDSAYELFYSRVGQHTSVGNYWNDPYHQSLYEQYSVFLPYINNHVHECLNNCLSLVQQPLLLFFLLIYSRVGQHTSVGNYWNDPYHQSLYEQYSVFLPYINNHVHECLNNCLSLVQQPLLLFFLLIYSRVGQHTSVGNYWNDPYHQSLYEQYSVFLPYINNHVQSAQSSVFKANILKLKRLVLVGGPDDNVITPWQSSQFGYYDTNNETVIDLFQQPIYLEDKIGLRTLDKQKKLHLVTIPGVNHFNWHMNVTIVDDGLLPYLD
ncbi:palmitoyl protein thioesterase domain-containing protein [Phthorimaea operculella]|nr:palmitoyl protein thioesterase domain-containing protein [Phthorimaea operculella]